jgi:2-keto-4-pentenoate hydratase
MDKPSARSASDLLARCWREGRVIDALPAALRPSSREEGYAIQAEIETQSTKPLFGWKIAATSLAGQKHIGVDGPLAGRLLAERVHGDGDEIPFGANRMRVAECEFAFRMGRDLPPRETPYEQDEVLDAVADLCLAIEVPDSRYADFVTAGGPQIIADNACAHRFLLGPPAPSVWRELDLAAHRVLGTVSRRYEREGVGANVLGHPLTALTWLANELSGISVPLRAGQVVTTGTCLKPLEIDPGDEVSVDYGVLGRVGCRFAAA